MGFMEDAIFPTAVSYGTQGGPGFMTDIIVVDSGAEERNARWGSARHSFDAAYGVKSLVQLDEVRAFFHVVKGAYFGCRLLDPFDHSSSSKHRSQITTDTDNFKAPAWTDGKIGVGDGTKVEFQLKKEYLIGDGGTIQSRVIQKPIASSVLIGVNGVPQSSGWSVNPATGKVLFNTPPPMDENVHSGFDFHVPSRFGDEVDKILAASYDTFGEGAIPAIAIVEIGGELPNADNFFYGGSYVVEPMEADFSVSPSLGRAVRAQPTGPGRKIYLPPASETPKGGPHFYFANTGFEPFDIVTAADDGAAPVGLCAAKRTAGPAVLMGSPGDDGEWVLFS